MVERLSGLLAIGPFGFALLCCLSCGGEVQGSGEDSAPPIASCPGRFAECDGDPATVCETDLASSATHCGACDHACPAGSACGPRGCTRPDSVVELGGGAFTTCARTAGGKVYCWGRNENGEVGDGTHNERDVAVSSLVADVVGLSNDGATSICHRARDGKATCAGWFLDGVDRFRAFETPKPIPLDNVAIVETNGDVSCAVLRDGSTWCWGSDYCGFLGGDHPDPLAYDPTPRRMALPPAIGIALAASACSLGRDGRVRCWGDAAGLGGQNSGVRSELLHCIGHGFRGEAAVVPGVATSRVYCGGFPGQICAAGDAGAVACWGGRYNPPPTAPIDLDVPVQVGAYGIEHGCFLVTDGTVVCNGNDGSEAERRRGFRTVPGLTDIVDLHVGSYHTCVLGADGVVRCWGANDFGQLGDGTHERRSIPVAVKGLPPP